MNKQDRNTMYKRIMKLKNPNLSIILPGKCNAKCPFCCWKFKKSNPKLFSYRDCVQDIFEALPDNFNQISILGGEPMLSPYLSTILDTLSERRNDIFTKIVLTTNGTNLLKELEEDSIDFSVVNHVNISRHHYDEVINRSMFGTQSIPMIRELRVANSLLNKKGIDVNLNCVLYNDLEERFILRYINFAKYVGASSVCFKKLEGDDLMPTKSERIFSLYKTIGKGSCPTCRSKTQLIDGMRVTWQAALADKSKAPVQDLVIGQDGKLSSDWEGKCKIDVEELSGYVEDPPMKLKTVEAYRSCGAGTNPCGSRGTGC